MLIANLAFFQERMTYITANDSCDGVSKAIYQSKDGTSAKTFDALDWPRKGRRDANTSPARHPHPR